MGGRLGAAFQLQTPTFILPKEYVAFADAYTKCASGGDAARPLALAARASLAMGVAPEAPKDPNIWIMKPCAMSRGRGISLVKDIHAVCFGESIVIQVCVCVCVCVCVYVCLRAPARRLRERGGIVKSRALADGAEIHSQPAAPGRLQV